MNAPHTEALNSMASRSIGAILIDSGRLDVEDAERVLRLQRERQLRFGDAALQLGLLRESDIQFALSLQFDYPYLTEGESAVSMSVVAAYDPFSPVVESLRALRSQLILRWFGDESRRALAVVSAESGEGRSWVCANLAVVFSQLGERTLLIDADLRKPAQHELFGLDGGAGLSSILSGRADVDVIRRIPEFVDLSVLPAGAVPPNPQELLSRPILGRLLKQLSSNYDVVLVDTPAGTTYADGQTVAARAGGALLVSCRNLSRMRLLRSHSDVLQSAGVRLIGSVMNEHG